MNLETLLAEIQERVPDDVDVYIRDGEYICIDDEIGSPPFRVWDRADWDKYRDYAGIADEAERS